MLLLYLQLKAVLANYRTHITSNKANTCSWYIMYTNYFVDWITVIRLFYLYAERWDISNKNWYFDLINITLKIVAFVRRKQFPTPKVSSFCAEATEAFFMRDAHFSQLNVSEYLNVWIDSNGISFVPNLNNCRVWTDTYTHAHTDTHTHSHTII